MAPAHADGPGCREPLLDDRFWSVIWGLWRTGFSFPGIYLWRDPHGTIYLIDPTGTRTLRP